MMLSLSVGLCSGLPLPLPLPHLSLDFSLECLHQCSKSRQLAWIQLGQHHAHMQNLLLFRPRPSLG